MLKQGDRRAVLDIDAQLAKWNLRLPKPAPPAANYAPYVLHADTLYISGNVPLLEGTATYVGVVPHVVTVEAGYAAAQLCALGILAQIGTALDGDFDRVVRVLKITGLVRSAPEFSDVARVVNGASDLFVHVFGERGVHARTSLGVSALPRGVGVEIDAIVAVDLKL